MLGVIISFAVYLVRGIMHCLSKISKPWVLNNRGIRGRMIEEEDTNVGDGGRMRE